MAKLFGTDGVRGEYEKEITPELARKIAYLGCKELANKENANFLIITDTRKSRVPLQKAVEKGIKQAGFNAYRGGIIPTPSAAVIVKELGFDGSIVITASHNTFEYNGIKFFDKDGYKLPDSIEEKIEEAYFNSTIPKDLDEKGEVYNLDNAKEIYFKFLNSLPHESLKDYKIVLDCANGASYEVAGEYFRNLGANVICIANTPDGENINVDCGSTNLENLSKAVLENKANFGFAFDGDADRVKAVDEKGQEIDGDKILYLLSKDFKQKGKLNNNTLVVTQMSNMGLPEALEKEGITCIRTDVGDRYVLEEMLNNHYNLGGEQAGHIILSDLNSTGDGLLTASVLADIFALSNKKVSELFDGLTIYPQVLKNAKLEEYSKKDYESDPVIMEHIHNIEKSFTDKGRVYIRPSGTEPVIRVMIEGTDYDEVERLVDETIDLMLERLN